ncbi:hypothetical protein [uncultured Helicobacter sp.]|uniref:hypothetical protein n=1 Tax=uncultured Helicobacter sp. TaxID=175537 RepID=UPI0025FB36AD|nr:hypothetical protein [uncultured Helicobacter sp.]
MDLSPNSLFMLISIFCVAVLALVVALWFFGPAPKKPEPSIEVEMQTNIEDIMKVLDNPKSDLIQLRKAAESFFTYYNDLQLSDYRKKAFLFAVTVHRNTSTELIINAEERLKELNPDLTRDLNKTLSRALDARGIA